MKPYKDHVEHLDLTLSEFPVIVRCSLSGCPSHRHGNSGGQILIEVLSLESMVRQRKRCRACGAMFVITMRSPGRKSEDSQTELMTRREVARALRISESTVDRLRREGSLPALKIGRGKNSSVRFRCSDVNSHFANAEGKKQ